MTGGLTGGDDNGTGWAGWAGRATAAGRPTAAGRATVDNRASASANVPASKDSKQDLGLNFPQIHLEKDFDQL